MIIDDGFELALLTSLLRFERIKVVLSFLCLISILLILFLGNDSQILIFPKIIFAAIHYVQRLFEFLLRCFLIFVGVWFLPRHKRVILRKFLIGLTVIRIGKLIAHLWFAWHEWVPLILFAAIDPNIKSTIALHLGQAQ